MKHAINTRNILMYMMTGAIVLFSFFPDYLNYTVLVKYDIFINLTIVSLIIFYLMYYQKIHKYYLLVSMFLIIQLFSTILHHGQIASAIWGKGILLLYMCVGIQFTYNYNENIFLKNIYCFFYLLIIINFISLLLFPDGMYEDIRGIKNTNFFLGNYNGFIIYIYPTIAIGYIFFKKYSNKIPLNYIILWFISLGTIIIKGSITSLFGLCFLVLYMILFNNKVFRYIFNIKTYLIFNISFFYFLVWNNSNSWLLKKMVNLLGKDITFTGRTKIWQNAKVHIMNHLLLGNGLESAEVLSEKLNLYDKMSFVAHTHNLVIDVLYKSGLGGFIVFSMLFLLLLQKVKRLNDTKIRYFLEAFLSIFLLMSQFEAYNIKPIFIILTILYFYTSNNQITRTGKIT